MESSLRPARSRVAWACLSAALIAGGALDSSAAMPAGLRGSSKRSDRETVGHKADGRSVTPVNQTLTPLGRQIELTGLRPQAMALSPDGSRLLVSGKTRELLVLSPVTGEILQRVPLPSEQVNEPQPAVPSANILKPDAKGQVVCNADTMICSVGVQWSDARATGGGSTPTEINITSQL